MKIRYFFILLSSILLFPVTACRSPVTGSDEECKSANLIKFVDPFIGTKNMGHTYPGATAPFGMVQLSPETNFVPMFREDGSYIGETYRYCSGYQYEDSTIYGFSHTHFSGTGHADLGDMLVMPTGGDLETVRRGNYEMIYSGFSHEEERAEPGYYSVHLDDFGINAELTASERVGFHRYTSAMSEDISIILDLVYNIYHHDDKNVWSFVRVENDTLVTGYRQTNGWARTKYVYFAMAFSKPVAEYGHKRYEDVIYNGFYRRFDEENNFPEMAGKDIRAWFSFNADDEPLLIKFALSPVSTAGALKNMMAEVPHWDFDVIRQMANEKWNKELSKVKVETINEEDKTTFYTALYHTMLGPIIYEDVDGSYRGLDQNIHQSEDFTNYTIFSLWDTYRALHPLFNILKPARNNDMIKSMLAHHDQSVHAMLPIWSHYANENWCMIGYHASSVIADAAVKDIGDFDHKHALDACVSTAAVEYFEGLGEYMEYGFVPDDLSHSSVSKTLEYAYNDWCIAQLANKLGNSSFEQVFLDRAQNYRKVYDKESGFMRPRLSDGSFRSDFDPMDTHGQGFIEGNAWNYGLYVPQEPEVMIDMMGGKEAFAQHLDSLFTMEIDDHYIAHHEDITRDGIIGNYVHGNEPGHHIPYLYNYTGYPEKTQARVRMIMEEMYGTGPDGLCGNDDAGQMSAWYVFSALGFYPVCPGSIMYELGSPNIVSADIRLENGNTLKIIAKNQSLQNIYVKSVSMNGKTIEGHQISHHELMRGGELVFEMSDDIVIPND